MNKWLMIAGVLSSLVFLLHLIGGEVGVHQPLLSDVGSAENRAFSSVLWHFVSAALLINTAALFIAATNVAAGKPLVWLVIAQYAAFAAIFLFYGVTRLGTVMIMPQWILFIIILVPTWLGIRRT